MRGPALLGRGLGAGLALALALACGRSEERVTAPAAAPAAPPAASAPAAAPSGGEAAHPAQGSRPSVLVLGLDGALWPVMDPLMQGGALPNLARLVASGARGPLDCVPAMPNAACYCPPVWVSIATGVPESRHGINEVADPASQRRAAALWRVLHVAGGTTTAVSYRNTWKPEKAIRYVMTEPGLDWLAEQRFTRIPPDLSPRDRDLSHHTRPPDLFETLGLVPYEGERPPARAIVARDRVAREALLRLARRERTDLTFILIHSTDKLEHLMWGFVQPTPADPVDGAVLMAQARQWREHGRRAGGIGSESIASVYMEVDDWLGQLLAATHYDYILVVSDHGMARNTGEGLSGEHGPQFPAAHQGVFALAGPGVRAGARLEGLTVLDVAPTLAWLLDLPVADDLPGHVLVQAFEPDWVAAHPLRHGPSWTPPGMAGRAPGPRKLPSEQEPGRTGP